MGIEIYKIGRTGARISLSTRTRLLEDLLREDTGARVVNISAAYILKQKRKYQDRFDRELLKYLRRELGSDKEVRFIIDY